MSYRDDLNAAHERLRAMEEQLAELREEHAEDRSQLEAERDVAVAALEQLRDLENELSELRQDQDRDRERIKKERDAVVRELRKTTHKEKGSSPKLSEPPKLDPPKRGRSRLARLGVAALIMAVVWLTTLALTAAHPALWLVAFFSLPLWYFLFDFFSSTDARQESCGGVLIIACFVSTLPSLNEAPIVWHGLWNNATTEVSLVRAAEHQDALLVRLDQGRVATEHQISGSWALEDENIHALIAPIVGQDWNRDTPITAWAVCTTSHGPDGLDPCTSSWAISHSAGIVVRRSDNLRWAIRDGLASTGLTAHEDALFVRWEEPEPTAQLLVRLSVGTLLVCFVFWTVWFFVRGDP